MNVIASQMSCGGKSGSTSCGMSADSEYEQDQEGDREPEQSRGLGQREAEEGERRDLRRRIAGERADQRRKHVADADAGADERDAGEAGADHFGGSEIHDDTSLVPSGSVKMDGVVEIKAGQNGED